MELGKRVLRRCPRVFEAAIHAKLWLTNRPLASYSGLVTDDPFGVIHRENIWKDQESKSGPGSNLGYTAPLRHALPGILRSRDIHSMLDAPCGDFSWMQKVDLPVGFDYVGSDIVPELVDGLRAQYASPTRRFVTLDVRHDMLPEADLWLCRDCLIHLSNADAFAVLENFASSKIRYLLTTTYNFGSVNSDIVTGNFRLLNLRARPFQLPTPLEFIFDYVDPWPPRRLALWSNQQIRRWVQRRAT
jgi:hypothetical protein